MDKKNLMPQAAQPVNRTSTGQLPAELAELSEEALQLHGDDSSNSALLASGGYMGGVDPTGVVLCSYDGDEAE